MKHVKEWEKPQENAISEAYEHGEESINWEEVDSTISELWQVCKNIKTIKKLDGTTLAYTIQGILNRLETALDH